MSRPIVDGGAPSPASLRAKFLRGHGLPKADSIPATLRKRRGAWIVAIAAPREIDAQTRAVRRGTGVILAVARAVFAVAPGAPVACPIPTSAYASDAAPAAVAARVVGRSWRRRYASTLLTTAFFWPAGLPKRSVAGVSTGSYIMLRRCGT